MRERPQNSRHQCRVCSKYSGRNEANSVDPDQTEQSDQSLHCFPLSVYASKRHSGLTEIEFECGGQVAEYWPGNYG